MNNWHLQKPAQVPEVLKAKVQKIQRKTSKNRIPAAGIG